MRFRFKADSDDDGTVDGTVVTTSNYDQRGNRVEVVTETVGVLS